MPGGCDMLALTQSKADIRAYHRIVECYGKYITE